jgi:hypothetical protein
MGPQLKPKSLAGRVMPSHLSTIGFAVETGDDFARLAEQISAKATEVQVKAGRYLRWTGSGGEELWLQLSSRRDLIGMNPHFSGASRVRVGIVNRVTRPNDTKLDGALHAWASPSDDSPSAGDYPFVFDVPDAAACLDLEIPSVAEAQIAAFAHEVSVFPSEEAFAASQTPDSVQFADRSFIPAGLFSPDGVKDGPPAAEAIFTGHVLQAEQRANTVSNQKFWWALVDTLGGTYDVVIDPTLLEEPPIVGGILSGSFWLSGRLISYPRRKKSWFGQLLGGAG